MKSSNERAQLMFYPATAEVPERLSTAEFLIRPLRATDAKLDYEAVISSRAELWLRSGNTWPREDFTLDENLADLVRHEQEHRDRVAFTFTVMHPTETECLGCIYINPLPRMLERAGGSAEQIAEAGDYAAWVTFWVRQSRLADDLDVRVLETLLAWFNTAWAFSRVVFAARKTQERQIRLFTEAGLHLAYSLPNSLVFQLL
jgi:RimJ/RimL family protein N-acetyltransferase